MKLDDKQKENLLKHFNKNWPEPNICPICKNDDWALSDTIFGIQEYNKGKFIIGGSTMPLIPLVCKICGHTILFNAISIGIVEPDKKEVKNEE